jgi:ABC-type uncharacterized transport system ATPase component
MMNEGKIVFDCQDGEKEKLTIDDLIAKFTKNDASLEADGLF